MALPNMSYMVSIGQIRYMQYNFEHGALAGSDHLVGKLLTRTQKTTAALRHFLLSNKLLHDPFYRYLRQRTIHYDDVFVSAIYGGFDTILNIGAGSDTRAYRFSELARKRNVRLIEADQHSAITTKQEIATQAFGETGVCYLTVDMNDPFSETFDNLLSELENQRTLIMLEGVSPYLRRDAFVEGLKRMRGVSGRGSRLAYDYKLEGFGSSLIQDDPTPDRFRLSADQQHVRVLHESLGFEIESLVSSESISNISGAIGSRSAFVEDTLLIASLVYRN